jgi:hypothetical protein
MISYTVTTQKTQGQYRSSFTRSISFSYILPEDDIQLGVNEFTTVNSDYWLPTGRDAETIERFQSSNGGFSSSYSFSFFYTNNFINFGEFSESGSRINTGSFTLDSNSAGSGDNVFSLTVFFNENEEPEFFEGSFPGFTELSPTTISGQTTTTEQVSIGKTTTDTAVGQITVGTTTVLSSSTFPTSRPVSTQTTHTTFSQLPYTITRTTTHEIATNLVTFSFNEQTRIGEPPRDTATIFCELQNAVVWVPTASALQGAGPWALSDIASSYTSDFTALPFYSISPLKVLAASEATFPEPPENPETITEMRVALSQIGQDTRTIWTTHSRSGFPLESRNAFDPKFTTYESEHTYTTFTENNSLLTVPATEIGSQFSNSAEIKHINFPFQEFYEFSYLTTRYLGTWSSTFSTQYAGKSTNDFDGPTITFVNVDIAFAEGVTIEGTNVEQIQIRAFSPCAVSHVETSFTDAWGLHGNDGPQPVSQISFGGELSVRFSDFAELLPGVSVPYPTTYSWRTGSTSYSASLQGNAITVTTSFGTTSDSATYEFSGSEPAHTEQLTGRQFFTNLQGLPALSFFGPHAATGSVETRARRGEFVSIVQDSLGDFTLSTLTNETTSAATLSKNAVVFPGEKSFYTTRGGVPFLVYPRNPIP